MDGTGGLDADTTPVDRPLGVAAFRALVERSRDLLAVADRAGRYVYVSPSHAEVVGWTPEDLLGQFGSALIHPGDAGRVAAVLGGQIASGSEPPPLELRFRHRDGSWVWLELVTTNLLDDPAVEGFVTHARDITYRHRADELAADQARILEHVARGEDVSVVLGEVAEMVERWLPDATGVVVVHDGPRLKVAAAPHLPDECVAILESLESPSLEQGRRDGRFCVMSTRTLRRFGYEAAWAAAIGDGNFGALGAVIAYRLEPDEPTAADRQVLELAGNVAGICIERRRAERRLRDLALPDPLTRFAHRKWDAIIAGEGTPIGTVHAPDEATARSLAVELAEALWRNVEADFDPDWIHVRAKDPTGLLIIRAWIEYGSTAPLRAELTTTSDVANGIERQSVHSNAVEVETEVHAWLRGVLSDNR